MKPMMAEKQQPPPPKPVGEIAGERHHHGGGDDVGRQNPGDLVGRGGKGAEHMRDRHIDDGHVEHFEHRGQHHGDDERDRRPLGLRLGEVAGGGSGGGLRPAAFCRRARFGRAHCPPLPARWCRS